MELEETASSSIRWERRSPGAWNRVRRFINSYWLVPLLVLLLQLSTQLFYQTEPPLERLYKGNLAFFRGAPIFYEIATADFPYTLIGHFLEMIDYSLYEGDFHQISRKTLEVASRSPGAREEIYRRLIDSRSHRQSELGGVLTLSYSHGPAIRLHEIPSLNEIYSGRLHEAMGSTPRFLALIGSKEGREVFEKVGVEKRMIEEMSSLLKNDRLSRRVGDGMIRNFVEMYDTLSDSHYLLSPLQFKEALGEIPFTERYVGLYHFHNGMEEPPSEIDVGQSLRRRQIVMTFSPDGWELYDIVKGEIKKTNIEVDNRIRLQ